ncbi:NAD(P)/FAD-dependent oxidoreductase [Saccharopolyspora mangrovi]|uniref:FAD-dependent oxidoreductase n=1 Tax=Saccharopolyspora mangrovi TaxID=3082379 RepID=A0ABU6A5M1_9PSEU|nr:FAD-dependent oxidoreductase [Saccharopolyspora sp. S2-29]MEB3366705.1 FAD-dependent oxidoreductase [Saccharopolyspora sp. S2-29]
MGSAAGGAPGTVVVVGAGVVGLSTAWFLQERGVEVTVVDRSGVAAGASWGNAGYVAPAFSVPLPEPAVLRYGLRSLFDPNAPLYVPRTADPGLWAFLAGFARHCTHRTWQRSMRSLAGLNADCLDAFDELAKGGVGAPAQATSVVAAFERPEQAGELREEFERTRLGGQETWFADGAAFEVPQLSSLVRTVLRVEGQRYIDPGEFTRSLAEAVEARGGRIHTGFTVRDMVREGDRLLVKSTHHDYVSADSVVLATGAWLPELAVKAGVQRQVRAGRGYSFTVPVEEPVPGPIYLPAVRVACTPYQGGLRVAGTMEFRPPDAALDGGRIEAIVRTARPFLRGVDWEGRHDEWVGPRPVTADGLPLIGASRVPGVHVAGGHGMWGLTLGPITGRLLSEQIVTGERPAALRPFDPLR